LVCLLALAHAGCATPNASPLESAPTPVQIENFSIPGLDRASLEQCIKDSLSSLPLSAKKETWHVVSISKLSSDLTVDVSTQRLNPKPVIKAAQLKLLKLEMRGKTQLLIDSHRTTICFLKAEGTKLSYLQACPRRNNRLECKLNFAPVP
jgi:hypothetical protein